MGEANGWQKSWQTKGILNPKVGETKFQLSRYMPAADLTFFVDRYWIIHWDLRGQAPFTQETLPYPCVHLVFERDNTRIFGIERGKFSRTLEGKGQVFGIKFQPGGFYPFVNFPIAQLTEKTMPLGDVFDVDAHPLEAALFALDDAAAVTFVDDFLSARLCGRLPERDANVTLINEIINCIIAERRIIKVDDVVTRCNISKRSLQRLFRQYVGVTPKWVIQRYRLQEAAEQLAEGSAQDGSRLAAELGYFDQAHFIKDFKALVGMSPTEYAKRAQ